MTGFVHETTKLGDDVNRGEITLFLFGDDRVVKGKKPISSSVGKTCSPHNTQ